MVSYRRDRDGNTHCDGMAGWTKIAAGYVIKNVFFFILRITTTSGFVETPRDARCAYEAATVCTRNNFNFKTSGFT